MKELDLGKMLRETADDAVAAWIKAGKLGGPTIHDVAGMFHDAASRYDAHRVETKKAAEKAQAEIDAATAPTSRRPKKNADAPVVETLPPTASGER